MNTVLKKRKLSHPASEVTRLKMLWRDKLPEAERDYWREQLSSARSLMELRGEMQGKYNIALAHDIQVTRFRRWLEDEELRKQLAEEAECDRAELAAQGLDGKQLRDELLKRIKERALARGDYKLGLRAVRLDLEAERLAWQRRREGDGFNGEARRPGGLTPETLEKIERKWNLM